MKPAVWPWFWLLAWYGAALATLPWDASYRLGALLQPPGISHWFGTDAFGRNLLLLTLKSSIRSTGIAAIAMFLTLGLGSLVGILGAVASYPVQVMIRRSLEFFLALPSLLLALAIAAIQGPSERTLILALTVGSIPSFSRMVMTRTNDLLHETYVHAAESLGANLWQLTRAHLLPAVLSFCSVKIPNLLAEGILAEATLSFLGVGVPVGVDTWGHLLYQGREYLLEAPYIAVVSGLPLFISIAALQRLSESWLEFNPKRARQSPESTIHSMK